MTGDFRVRYLTSDEDVRKIFVWLIPHWREATTGRGDPDKILREVWNIVNNGVAMVVEHEGEWIGSMGLFQVTPWAGTEEDAFWDEYWLTVRPEFRFKSPAGKMMFSEAEALVEASGVPAVLTLWNQRRFSRKRVQTIGEKIRIEPVGTIVRINPRAQHERRQDLHDEQQHVDELPRLDADGG